MINVQLKNIDPEDINDIILKIEKSFNINFDQSELSYVKTFGQLCDHVINKIQLKNNDDCTIQQAFYKIREIISHTNSIHINSITPDLLLEALFPRNERRNTIKNLEHQLGIKLNILRPPSWITNFFFIILIVSFIGLFLIREIALLGIGFSFAGFYFSGKYGKEFDLQTLGELTKKIARENYLKFRSDPKTFNKGEIEEALTDLFSYDLGLEKSKLTKEAQFIERS